MQRRFAKDNSGWTKSNAACPYEPTHSIRREKIERPEGGEQDAGNCDAT
jgi:hypothetical protein